MHTITFTNIFSYEKNHVIKILSSLIVKLSLSLELLQVKFINWYLKENISFTKNDIRDWDQSTIFQDTKCIHIAVFYFSLSESWAVYS